MAFPLNSLTIQFIQSTPTTSEFSINFRQFDRDNEVKELTTQQIVLLATQSLHDLTLAFAKAVHITLASSGATFRHIVLGYYGPFEIWLPENIYLIIFKIAFWIFAMGYSVFATTSRLYWNTNQGTAYLECYSGGQLDVSHIRTKQLALDDSKVPPEIKVDLLAPLLKEINFTDPQKLGYRDPTQIGGLEKLEKDLNTYINNVKKEIAFTGTPKEYDTVALIAFYRQLEAATRLSLHKATKALQDFIDRNGAEIGNYS